MPLRRKLKNLLRELDKHSPWPVLYSFIMTKKEKALFDKEIKRSKTYLEFGTGGSTIRALKKSGAKIYSVDSSADWITSVRKYWVIRRAEKKRLSLFHVDIGPVKEWGTPVGNDSKELFPHYSSGVFRLVEKEYIDIVLIDGRFRVACALKTILECSVNNPPRILIHDFWNREEYHILLKYLEEADRADTLGAFIIKKSIDLDSVIRDYELYKYIPA